MSAPVRRDVASDRAPAWSVVLAALVVLGMLGASRSSGEASESGEVAQGSGPVAQSARSPVVELGPSAGPAAQPAEPDSSLDDFLGGLSDSTDLYFGISAAPADTAGNDSALAYALENPWSAPRERRFAISAWPDFAFNRVDGPVWGARLGIGRARLSGQMFGNIGYAAGPNDWLGVGGIRRSIRTGNGIASLELSAGRRTVVMERERRGHLLASVRALVSGRDFLRYYRRDGFDAALGFQTETWLAEVGYRDELESPLATTTTWNFAKRVPAVIDNLPATLGRVRELELVSTWRLPLVPVIAEVSHQTSGSGIGSDFEYRRTQVATSGNFGLWGFLSAIPQLSYGRLTESLIPQAAFYLGGSHSLRSLPGASRGGTRKALARIDLIEAPDILALAHIPHPAVLPIQLGVFAAIGAVWGPDPYGGPSVPGERWPDANVWMSEAGASLIYQPGIPDPTLSIRLNYAVPLGPARESMRWTVTVSRALDLVRSFGD